MKAFRGCSAWAIVLAVACGCGTAPSKTPVPDPADGPKIYPQPVAAPHLPNAYRLHANVISGGLPDVPAVTAEPRSARRVESPLEQCEACRSFGRRAVV